MWIHTVTPRDSNGYGTDRKFMITNGVDTEKYRQYNENKIKNSFVFHGNLEYQPNIDAVLWFVDNVIEKIDKKLNFLIVGAKPTQKIKELEDKYANIKVTGFVDDPYEILNSCLCVVAPMQTGAGIQNKILETMALGTINIVSELAAKPIGAEDKKEFLIIDKPELMANTINNIFTNQENYCFLKQNAKEFIKKNFTWSIYGKVYTNKIERLINDNKN